MELDFIFFGFVF